jgi:hypothetical protein
MATTISGFVIRTFAGRAGLFTATIQKLDGSAPVEVQVSDLDGEPERFNERLTKVRLFRDAMTQAEPVVVDYEDVENGGREVESVRNLARDHLWIGSAAQDLVGVVGNVSVEEQSGASGHAEHSDIARIALIDPVSGEQTQVQLALQRAERSVTSAMLELLRTCHETGDPVAVRVVEGGGTEAVPSRFVLSVTRADLAVRQPVSVDCFVERVGVEIIHARPFARVRVTTVPRFVGSGGTVDPSFYRPQELMCYVAKGSHMLELLEQSLNAGQRVRLSLARPTGQGDDDGQNPGGHGDETGGMVPKAMSMAELPDITVLPDYGDAGGRVAGLVLGVELLAPLASAVRPVWVRVRREALDQPPPGECLDGTPTSDLAPVNVASLQVPHRAAWEGVGCFNRGVYRVQIVAPVAPRIFLDGKELPCVTAVPFTGKGAGSESEGQGAEPSKDEVMAISRDIKQPGDTKPWRPRPGRQEQDLRVYLAHICVEDCHTLRIEFDEWRCGYVFDLDVMKLR